MGNEEEKDGTQQTVTRYNASHDSSAYPQQRDTPADCSASSSRKPVFLCHLFSLLLKGAEKGEGCVVQVEQSISMPIPGNRAVRQETTEVQAESWSGEQPELASHGPVLRKRGAPASGNSSGATLSTSLPRACVLSFSITSVISLGMHASSVMADSLWPYGP